MSIEKQILDHLGGWMRQRLYIPNTEEQQCLTRYEKSPMVYGIANFAFWGTISYFTLSWKMPKWLLAFGALSITSGVFATTYWSAKIASRTCLQCILNERDKNSEFYKAVREIINENHPDAQKFFNKEKR